LTSCRLEQLNISADPGFNIDIDMGFDLSNFEVSSLSEPLGLLSPHTLASSQTSIPDNELLLEEPAALEDYSSHGLDHDFQIDIGGPQNAMSARRASSVDTGGLGLAQEGGVFTNSDIGINDDEIVLLPQEIEIQQVQRENEDSNLPLGDHASLNLAISQDILRATSPIDAVRITVTR